MSLPLDSFALLKSTSVPRGAVSRPDLEALAEFVLARQKVMGPVELTVDITGHKRIQELNRRFRGVDRTTDVISFRNDITFHPHPQPLSLEYGEGDIVLDDFSSLLPTSGRRGRDEGGNIRG